MYLMLFLTLSGQWQVKDTVFKVVSLMRPHDDAGFAGNEFTVEQSCDLLQAFAYISNHFI
jgi:hypothetical protein